MRNMKKPRSAGLFESAVYQLTGKSPVRVPTTNTNAPTPKRLMACIWTTFDLHVKAMESMTIVNVRANQRIAFIGRGMAGGRLEKMSHSNSPTRTKAADFTRNRNTALSPISRRLGSRETYSCCMVFPFHPKVLE